MEAAPLSATISLPVDVPAMVRSLAAQGSSTVDLLCAVRLHTGCGLREARAILSRLALPVQDPLFDPDPSSTPPLSGRRCKVGPVRGTLRP